MRNQSWKSVVALALVVAAYFAAYEHAQAQADAGAASVMADVRKALGGEQKVAGVKGLSLRADYRRELSAGTARASPSRATASTRMTRRP
jgi:hypothetical protein